MKASILALGAIAATAAAYPKKPSKGSWSPFDFTSTFEVYSVPEEVVNADGEFTGGLPDSYGLWKFGINSHENVICYNITLQNFRGEYESPAITATHIHEGEKGVSGPPRIIFPDPEGDDKWRISVGCVKGPFVTGVRPNDGPDAGEGFHVREIEENPKKYYVDVHSSLAVPGANRGQFSKSKSDC